MGKDNIIQGKYQPEKGDPTEEYQYHTVRDWAEKIKGRVRAHRIALHVAH
jgi:hypothetical protein